MELMRQRDLQLTRILTAKPLIAKPLIAVLVFQPIGDLEFYINF